MKRLRASLLASVVLLAACSNDKSTAPAPAPAASAPAGSVKPPVEAAKPPAETAKAPAEAAKPPAETAKAPGDAAKTPGETDIDKAYAELMAKPEDTVNNIEIQHILISFSGAPRMRGVTRAKYEARSLAQEVYAEALAGADFDALVKKYTNDSPPGIYPLDQTSRKGMVKSFGDVGWRLKVGEIGIATWDAQASPYGWHIIKRLK